MQTVQSLSSQFKVRWLSFQSGQGELIKAVIDSPAASGEIYLHGAHVTAWQPTGHEPVLWMSRSSLFQSGKPIRGGVPICFPWFGPHVSDSSAPAHGLVRTVTWDVIAATETSDGGVSLSLQTRVDSLTAQFTVEFGSSLKMTLTTQLDSAAPANQRFEDALHTYFSVSDVSNISVTGLEQTRYIDKVDAALEKPAAGTPISFTGETDRVYLDTIADCQLCDPARRRTINVSKSGSRSTVVWNPWIAKSARMPDFGDHEWPEMVCIETANVGLFAVELAPGESHTTTAVLQVR